MTAAADLGPFPGAPARALRTASTPVARRRPALELVATARTDAPRAPFVAVLVSLLAVGLLGLLGLNTVLAQDAFALHTLTQDGRSLADREQTLSREVEALRSPQALAARAAELGMVQAGPPAFLRLPDGVVLGAATPAQPPGVVGPDGVVVPAAPLAAGQDVTADEPATSQDSDSDTTADATADTTATSESTSDADTTTDTTTDTTADSGTGDDQ